MMQESFIRFFQQVEPVGQTNKSHCSETNYYIWDGCDYMRPVQNHIPHCICEFDPPPKKKIGIPLQSVYITLNPDMRNSAEAADASA